MRVLNSPSSGYPNFASVLPKIQSRFDATSFELQIQTTPLIYGYLLWGKPIYLYDDQEVWKLNVLSHPLKFYFDFAALDKICLGGQRPSVNIHSISSNPSKSVHWVEPPTYTEFCSHNVLSQHLKFLIDFEALVRSNAGVKHPNDDRRFEYKFSLLTTPHWADSPVKSFSAAFLFRTIREITSSDMSWDMTPVRRKNYRRGDVKQSAEPLQFWTL